MGLELNAVYDSREAIPTEPINPADLYIEAQVNGKTVFVPGIKGIKTQIDIDRQLEANRKERETRQALHGELTTYKASLGPWASLKPEEIQAKVDGYEALELAAQSAGKVSAEEVQKRVEAELKRHTEPLRREATTYKEQVEALAGKVQTYEQKERQRAIHDAVRSAALSAKMLDTAVDDALMLAERVFEIGDDGKITVKDQVGYTPGIDPSVWLSEIQAKRPHWWPPSQGGGARGGNGSNQHMSNPWAEDSWNVTAQGDYEEKYGVEKADQMARLAGLKDRYAPRQSRSK